MKRIVREINPGIIDTEDRGGRLREVRPGMECIGERIIDQITFEQALREVQEKPLAWIEDGIVYWVWCTEEGLIDSENHFFKIMSHKDGFNHFWFYDFISYPDEPPDHKTLQKHILNKPCFQSESWSEFYERDLPILIRMVREGV